MGPSLFSKFSIGSIVAAILDQATAMFRHELELARIEITRKIKGLAVGGGLLMFGFGLLFLMLVLLIIAGVAALTEYVWPLWLSSLVGAAAVLGLALIFLGIGAVKIRRNKDLRPERAVSAFRSASRYFD